MPPPLSILDLAFVGAGQSVRETLEGTVTLARTAEALGYRRVWYAEHHNLASIASSAPAVLIAHVAAHTHRIRLGAGGVMLPNHAPLTIAEQFGTLESLHPGRIDLGLGRAPGSDQQTFRALRRAPDAADRFPQDVVELQGYLGDESCLPGVSATPGRGTRVPLYILGSSLFGASLAAALGLPFAFASHFAPAALERAIALYRQEFRPSAQAARPHLMVGVNVFVADTTAQAEASFIARTRALVTALFGRGQVLDDAEADALLRSPAGAHVTQMLTCSAVGPPSQVKAYLDDFARRTGADELILAFGSAGIEARVRSAQLVAEAMDLHP